jgi:hypothetical protein
MANIRGRFPRLCIFVCLVTWDGFWFSVLQHQPVSFVILYALTVMLWDLRDSIMLAVVIRNCCLSFSSKRTGCVEGVGVLLAVGHAGLPFPNVQNTVCEGALVASEVARRN